MAAIHSRISYLGSLSTVDPEKVGLVSPDTGVDRLPQWFTAR